METQHQRSGGTGLGIFVGFVTGFLWFFLSFAAMFNGVFVFLLLLIPAYAFSGALLVWIFRLSPFHAAMSLVAPALPWVAWLWPATMSSSGWLKSLAWPAFVGTAFGLSLLGAQFVATRHRRKPTQPDSALA